MVVVKKMTGKGVRGKGQRSYHKDMFAVKLSTLLCTLGTDLGSLAEVLGHVVRGELRQRLNCGIVPVERGG